ncbi:MAG: hypothetical protein ABW001_13650 [Mycobacterium sp.]
MAIGDYDLAGPIARARRVLRDEPEPGWPANEEQVIAAVRETPRGGWPLTVVDPDPSAPPGTIAVTDLALKASVVHALRDDRDYAVVAIDVVVEETAVRGVRLELSGRYDADLNAAARRALAGCARVVDEVIGDVPTIPVEVVVTDVHR